MSEMTADEKAAYAARVTNIESQLSWFGGNYAKLAELDREFYSRYLLAQWEVAKTVLVEAKAKEMDLRVKYVKCGIVTDKTSGTVYAELDNGYRAKAVLSINYGFVKNPEGKVDKKRIDSVLERIENTGPVGALIADRLIKWTPDLSVTEYKKLPEVNKEFKNWIDEILVTSEGAPTLEIVAPKGK